MEFKVNDFNSTKYITVNKTDNEHNIIIESTKIKTEEMLLFTLLQIIQNASNNNKMKVVECLLDNRNDNNEIIISYQKIRDITGLSLTVIQFTMTELLSTGILVIIRRTLHRKTIYKINEDIISTNNINKKSIKINITYKEY